MTWYLENMKRGYTTDDYRRLVGKIRERLDGRKDSPLPGRLDRHRYHRGLPRRDRSAVPAHLRPAGGAEDGRGAPGALLHPAGHGG